MAYNIHARLTEVNYNNICIGILLYKLLCNLYIILVLNERKYKDRIKFIYKIFLRFQIYFFKFFLNYLYK